MKKSKRIISLLLLASILLVTPAMATESDGAQDNAQNENYFDFELPEYDSFNLTPEQKEIVDYTIGLGSDEIYKFVLMFKASFLSDSDTYEDFYYAENPILGDIFKMFEEDLPIEDIIDYHIKCIGKYYCYYYDPEYSFDKDRIRMKLTHKSYDLLMSPKWPSDEYDHALIKTAFRDDLFESVKITENYRDIEVFRSYFNSGLPHTVEYPMTAIFLTNHGIFVFYKFRHNSPDEYLFPLELVYEYADSSDKQIEKLMANDGVDITQYAVRVPSNELPLPTADDLDIPPKTGDPSMILALMSVISAGGFTLFASKKPKKERS